MFVVGRKYKRVVARRGAPIAVDVIVSCIFSTNLNALLRSDDTGQEYLVEQPRSDEFIEYVPPITRTFFFIIGERVIGMNNNENDIHCVTYVKNLAIPDTVQAEAMYRRNQPNHRIVSVREISHTYGFGVEVGDMEDDL